MVAFSEAFDCKVFWVLVFNQTMRIFAPTSVFYSLTTILHRRSAALAKSWFFCFNSDLPPSEGGCVGVESPLREGGGGYGCRPLGFMKITTVSHKKKVPPQKSIIFFNIVIIYFLKYYICNISKKNLSKRNCKKIVQCKITPVHITLTEGF